VASARKELFMAMEFIEVFKNETEYLHAMITAAQEKFVLAPGRRGTVYIYDFLV
jgi:serine protein kinase